MLLLLTSWYWRIGNISQKSTRGKNPLFWMRESRQHQKICSFPFDGKVIEIVCFFSMDAVHCLTSTIQLSCPTGLLVCSCGVWFRDYSKQQPWCHRSCRKRHWKKRNASRIQNKVSMKTMPWGSNVGNKGMEGKETFLNWIACFPKEKPRYFPDFPREFASHTPWPFLSSEDKIRTVRLSLLTCKWHS